MALGTIGEVRIVVRVDMKDLQAQLQRVKKEVEKFKPVMKVKVDAGTFAAADRAVKKTTDKAEKEFKDATDKIEKEVRSTADFIANQMGKVERIFSGVARRATADFLVTPGGQANKTGALVPVQPAGLPQTLQTAAFVSAVQQLSRLNATVKKTTEVFGPLALRGSSALDTVAGAADRAADAIGRARTQARQLQTQVAGGGGFGFGGGGGGGFGRADRSGPRGIPLGGDLSAGNVGRINNQIQGLGAAARRTAVNMRNLIGSVLDFRIAIAALGLGVAVKSIVEIGDSFQNMKARLRIVTTSTAEFNRAFEDTKRLAIETATPLEDVINLYSRLKLSAERLGLSQTQLSAIVEATGKAIQVSGSVAAEASGTILQFTQAISGNFQASAQEFNSILEQSPRLAKALGEGLNELAAENFQGLGDAFREAGFGAEISTTQIKKLGEKGVIDAIDVLNALLTQLGELRGEFSELPNTVGRAGNRLRTQFRITFGEVLENTGLNEKLAGSFDELRKSLEDGELDKLLELLAGSLSLVAGEIERLLSFSGRIADFFGDLELVTQSTIDAIVQRLPEGLKKQRQEIIDELNAFRTETLGLDPIDPNDFGLPTPNSVLEEVRAIWAAIIKGSVDGIQELTGTVQAADPFASLIEKGPRANPRRLLIDRPGGRGGGDDAKKAKEKVDDLVQSLKEEIRVLKQVEALRKNEADLIKAENILKDAKLKLDEKTRDTISELNREISSRELGDQINELQREIKFQEGLNRALEKGSDAARLYEAVGGARLELSAGTAELLPKETQEYLRLTAALERLIIAGEKAEERAEALKDAIEAEDEIKKTIKANKELIAAYKISNREGRIVAKTQELIESGFMGSREAARQYAETLAKQEDVIDAITEANQRLIDLQEDLGLALKSAFSDAIVEGEKLKDVMEDLSKEIFDLVLQAVVLDPIADLLRPAPGTSIFGAAGSNPFGLIGTLFEKEPGTAGAGGLSEKTKEGLEGLGKESQRAQETIAEATESTKGLASGTEMTGQLLSGTLAPAALSTATSETLLNTTTGVLTASFNALTIEVNKCILALQTMCQTAGNPFGGGGGTPARFGGGPPLQQLGNGFFTTTGRKMGGLIAGPGSSNSDSILTALSNGEFVVNAAQTKKFLPLLEAINDNDFVRRQFGGLVGSVARTSDISGGQDLSRIDNSQNVTFNITGDDPQSIADEVMMRISELQGTATARQQRRALGGAFTRARGDGF